MRMKKQFILFKKETTYATDAAPTGANAVVTSGLKHSPLEHQTVNRNTDRSAYGNDVQLVTGQHIVVEWETEFVGSGTLGTAPAFGDMLKCCQMSETVNAGTSVIYAPNSAGTDSATIHYHLDGAKHTCVGAMGSWELKIDSAGIPRLKFRFVGLYVAPTAAADPTGLTGLTAYQQPKVANAANTTVCELHSTAVVMKSLMVKQGNDVQFYDDPGAGSNYVDIVDRNSDGSMTVVAPALGTKNYFNTVTAETLGNLKVVHGTTNATKAIFEAAGNRVQIFQPKYSEDKGRAMLDCNLSFVPTTANDDEYVLRFAAT